MTVLKDSNLHSSVYNVVNLPKLCDFPHCCISHRIFVNVILSLIFPLETLQYMLNSR